MEKRTKTIHVQMLERELEMRQAQNSGYSLRAFSRDLDLSPSLLSEVMAGKKGLSESRAKKILGRLGLTPYDQQVFHLSTLAHHARNAKMRERAAQALRVRRISDQEFALANKTCYLNFITFQMRIRPRFFFMKVIGS